MSQAEAARRAPTHNIVARNLLTALTGVVSAPAALHEPEFAGNEWEYVKECIDTGWVSTAGKFVAKFEGLIAEATGSTHVVATMNGTAALHACLLLAGVKPGDEVITPALSFVATANAIAYCGAIPHFADCEPKTLGLDPVKLDTHLTTVATVDGTACVNRITGRPVRAVVCMHAFGHPVQIEPLIEVCARHRLVLIEDAAESLGSLHNGQHTGTFAGLGALSFNGNKIATTGGGGAILIQDATLAARAKHLTTTAKLPHRWAYMHDMVGFNYRLPNINAALGCAQLERLDSFIERKRRLAFTYRDALAQVPSVQFVDEPPNSRSNFWLNTVLLTDGEMARDEFLTLANEAGFGCRPAWEPMHRLPMFTNAPRMDMSATEWVHARLVNLPSSAAIAGQAEA